MSKEKKTQNVAGSLEIRAIASIDEEVTKELEIEDITVEQAKAFLEKLDNDKEE